MAGFNEYTVLNWFAKANYSVMEWTNQYWWPVWFGMFFIGALIGMSPLKSHHEHGFIQIIFIHVRRLMILVGFILFCQPFIMSYIYDATNGNQLNDSSRMFLNWFTNLAKENWYWLIPSAISGWGLRICYHRYIEPFFSMLLRRLRHQQTNDKASDIREEQERFKAKDFTPQKHYKKDKILVGLDEKNKPIHIPADTWYETNMQVIGPTRYGKGVILGCLMDQAIRRGDGVIYIDPKKDRFAPHIMHQAAIESGRKFYYLTLHDEGLGKWAPFAGGTIRDGLSRMETAFGLEFTGDPGTDFYKSQEKKELDKSFKQTRNIEGLASAMAETEAHRINAELSRWKAVKSLCPKSGKGFSIEQALKENAVIYVQGSLGDSVIKTATKVFIIEAIQEAMRLDKERSSHLSMFIDEVRFLVSKQLADALATAVGFRVNIITAYQSINDLLNPDDKTLDGRSILQSINVNSQVKAVYGGADFDTAEWAANLSGTVQKQVTKFERTDIRASGGEIWQQQRMVGAQEENKINTNIVLTLPPRICVFIQPNQLASVCFTSFISVKDSSLLEEYLTKKQALTNPSPAKPLQKKESELEHTKAFTEDLSTKKKAEDPTVLRAKQSNQKTENTAKVYPFEKKEKPNSHNQKDAPATEKEVETKHTSKAETQKPTKESASEKSQEKTQPAPSDNLSDLSEEEREKRRAKNRARKARQKQRKKDSQPKQAIPDNATTEKNNSEGTSEKVEPIAQEEPKKPSGSDFDFSTINIKSDSDTLKLLEGIEEE